MSYLLSIVIPAYNAEHCLQRCLDSIYREYDGRVQVIVVNDGSRDGTKEVLAANEKRPGFIGVSSENRGEGGARNLGLEYAAGRYVWFVDADDEVTPFALPTIVGELGRDGFDCDLVVFGAEKRMLGHREVVKPGVRRELPDRTAFFVAFGDVFEAVPYNCCWNKLFRRDLIAGNSLQFKSYHAGEDAAFVTSYLPYVRSALVLDCAPYVYHLDETGNSARSTYDPAQILQGNLERLAEQGRVFKELGVSGQRVMEESYARSAFGAMGLIYRQAGGRRREFMARVGALPGLSDAAAGLTGCALPKKEAVVRFLARHPSAAYAYFKFSDVREKGSEASRS